MNEQKLIPKYYSNHKRMYERIVDLDKMENAIKEWKKEKYTIGLCHGCFDVLHSGHLRHFEAAKMKCNILIVSVTPDQYINKGPNRPIFPAEQRAELIAGLSVVDFSVINRWDTAVPLLEKLQPDIFFKGQEYENNADQVNPNFLLEKQMIEKIGGRVEYTREWVTSSSAAIKKMASGDKAKHRKL